MMLASERSAQGQSLEELLDKRAPAAAPVNAAANEKWKQMLEAFSANNDPQGTELCRELLGANQVLTPLQLQAAKMLLSLSDDSAITDSPDMALIKSEASKLVAEINGIEAKLAGIEVSFNQINKPFSQGSQSHYKWLQLEQGKKFWTEKRDALKPQVEALRVKYGDLKTAQTAQLEKQLLEVAQKLAAENEIDGALALCNLYLRKHGNTHDVAVRGQELVELKNMQVRVMKMAAAVRLEADALIKQGKWSAAQAALSKSKGLVESRIDNTTEKGMFFALLKPLEELVEKTLSDAAATVAEITAAAAAHPDEAQARLTRLQERVRDLPQMESALAEIRAVKMTKETSTYDKRLATVTELAQSDPTSARALLDEYRKDMTAEDFVTLRAKLQGTWHRLWEKELESIRADQDEAHSFLTKVSSSFQRAIEMGDAPAIREAIVVTPNARENLTRSKGLLAGGVKHIEAIPLTELDSVLKSRAEGLKASMTLSLAQLEHAEEMMQPSALLHQQGPQSGAQAGLGSPVMLGGLGAVLVLGVGICLRVFRRKAPVLPP